MSRSLQGYTTIDKSLSGVITISDGGGTTISEGTVECEDLIVHNDVIVDGTVTITDLTVTNNILTNNITFTGNMNDEITFSDLLGALNQMAEVYTSLAYDSENGGPSWDDPTATITWPNNMKFNLDLTVLGREYLLSPRLLTTDANFNNRNFLQLGISTSDTGGSTQNTVCGIDFSPWAARQYSSARIFARQNANSSSDLVFSTAGNGAGTIPSQRMVITASGSVGIGQTAPAYTLDITGNMRATTGVITNTIISTSATSGSSIMSDKTTGNINIAGAQTTGVCNIGNSTTNNSVINLYGTTNARILRVNAGIDTNSLEPYNTSLDMYLGTTATGKIIIGKETTPTNNMELNAITGQLIGTDWEVLSTIPAGDNSKKIANTEWVNANTVTQSMGITPSNYNNFDFISNSTDTSAYTFTQVAMSASGETGYTFNGTRIYKTSDSGSNWVFSHTASSAISSICCSNTGQYVYYSLSGTSKPLYSSDFGQTFTQVSTLVPQNSPHNIFCSYDGSIVCLAFPVTISGLITPYYNTSYGSTATWNQCGYSPVPNASSINDIVLDGELGTLNSMTIASGKTGNGGYVYYSSSPTTNSWVQKLTTQSIWSSLSFKQNNILYAGNNSGGGIHVSTDSGVSYTYLASTAGLYISSLDASKDGVNIFYCNTSGFFYSPNSGSSFTNFSTTSSVFLATSQSAKTTMIVPTSVTDTIYTFFTNPKVNFLCDMYLPKNRMILQSNLITDYGDNTDVFYLYKTQFLSVDTSNNFDLYWPMYSCYQIRPSGNATCYLSEVEERHVGIEIKIIKMSAHALNFVCSGNNLIWDYGVHTGVTSLAGTGLGSNVTSVTLMAIYGLSVSNPFGWAITSAP